MKRHILSSRKLIAVKIILKTFKICLAIALLFTVASCKKNDEVTSADPKLDFTNYLITMEFPTTFSGGRVYNLPALIVFENEEKSTIYWIGSSSAPQQANYKLEGDKLSVFYGQTNLIFTIKDESITATSGLESNPPKNVKLRQVPATNQFVGRYSGMLNSWPVNTAFPYKYVFNQTQFGEEMVAEPTLDYVMNPVKNVYARSVIDNVLRHFLIVDDKLIVARLKSGGTNAETFLFGALSKDQ